jgi:hypothetical protein
VFGVGTFTNDPVLEYLYDCGRLAWGLMPIHDGQKRFTGEQPGLARSEVPKISTRAVNSEESRASFAICNTSILPDSQRWRSVSSFFAATTSSSTNYKSY